VKKNAKRINGILAQLALRLTRDRETKAHREFAGFQPQIKRIWGEAKEAAVATQQAGGEVDRTETRAKIETALVATLDGVVSQGDAEMIASAILSRGK